MEYDVLKAQILAANEEYDKRSEEAKKSFDELIEKYFYSMRDKIVNIVKDLSQEEIYEWLKKAQKDDAISGKLFMLTQVCWNDANNVDLKDIKDIDSTSISELITDLALLHVLGRLL